MKKIKNIIRTFIPSSLLSHMRALQKKKRKKNLEQKRKSDNIIDTAKLAADLRNAGIIPGDTLLVHSSMSRIGYLKEGPKTFIDALLDALGNSGNILMPTSPNPSLQLDYIRKNPVFDVQHTPSAMGSITEYFRKIPGTERSLHPTEPVAALGPDAHWLTEGHFNQLTPYNKNSPFYRITEKNGKILMAGVTLDNAGTNLHTLEDAVDFIYPVYYPEVFGATVIDKKGNSHTVKIKVHNPKYSKKRKCDELIPMFASKGVLKKVKIGEANSLLIDAKKMLEVMIIEYKERGVTMYTPKGNKIK